MSISNSQAAPLALVLIPAMDMFSSLASPTETVTPTPDPRLAGLGWQVVSYLTAQDTVLERGRLASNDDTVYYGFLAVSTTNPTQYLAVVRGTHGFVEWVEDGEFVSIPFHDDPHVTVEDGFWDIYSSMALVGMDGQTIAAKAADGIAAMVKDGSVMVIGHSLGSALATYLSLDLALSPLKERVSACLFASPHPGNAAFARVYDDAVADYRVFNYILDVVPRVPLGYGYSSLIRTTVLQPAAAEASIKVNPLCNHHVICYSAMLDYEAAVLDWVTLSPDDQACRSCVLGPETGGPSVAKLLAAGLSL